MLVPEGPGRSISLAEKMLLESQFDAAIPVLNKTLSAPMSMQEKAYVNYTLASVYEAKGDVEMQIYYLAQTAIIDLTMAVREYASLQRLAWVLTGREISNGLTAICVVRWKMLWLVMPVCAFLK